MSQKILIRPKHYQLQTTNSIAAAIYKHSSPNVKLWPVACPDTEIQIYVGRHTAGHNVSTCRIGAGLCWIYLNICRKLSWVRFGIIKTRQIDEQTLKQCFTTLCRMQQAIINHNNYNRLTMAFLRWKSGNCITSSGKWLTARSASSASSWSSMSNSWWSCWRIDVRSLFTSFTASTLIVTSYVHAHSAWIYSIASRSQRVSLIVIPFCLSVWMSVSHSATYSLPRLIDHNQIWSAGVLGPV